MTVRWYRVLLSGLLCGLAVAFTRGFFLARANPNEAAPAQSGVTVSVYDHRAKETIEMPLEAYLVGVVAAEMPISFPLEALKAQAVAARTYTIYHALHGGCRQHDADVCTDSACCQAYASETRLKESWDDAYAENREKAARAVSETEGRVLLYENEPIEALYHSASGGMTENAEDVYTEALAYLRAVESTAEAGTTRLTGEKRFAKKAFAERINAQWTSAELSADDLPAQVEIVSQTPTGRVKSIRLGKTTATGRALRALLELDSTLFSVSFDGDEIVFSTRGYGHGVGMSQTGANAMALGGRTYEEILHYYYTNVVVGFVTQG